MDDLKTLQAPLKERYRSEPDAALITLKAEGRIGEGVTCSVQTGKALVEAGLHPATGGTGAFACSGDMLLEALVACAGVTLAAVATALGVNLLGQRPARRATWVSGGRGQRMRPWVSSPANSPRYRCVDQNACDPASSDRTLLRRLSDAHDPAGRNYPDGWRLTPAPRE